MKRFLSLTGLLALALIFAGCNGISNSSSSTTQNSKAQVFTTGEDAPVSSVVAFNITINSITLNNGSTTGAGAFHPDLDRFRPTGRHPASVGL